MALQTQRRVLRGTGIDCTNLKQVIGEGQKGNIKSRAPLLKRLAHSRPPSILVHTQLPIPREHDRS